MWVSSMERPSTAAICDAGETAGDAVFREKRREDGVRGELLGMSRWTWRDLMPAHSVP